jgi:hypothetical protein
MKADFEKRLEDALGAIVQHVPETKQEAASMTAGEWAAFQDAASLCIALHGELSGSIRRKGTWVQVGREAAERFNNAVADLAQHN